MTGRSNRRGIVIIAAAVVLLAAAVGAFVLVTGQGGGLLARRASQPSGDYPSATECAACHPDVVAAWQTSPHARAAANALTHASICGRCHTPVGVMLDPEYMFNATSSDYELDTPASAAEGVTCVVCHAPTRAPAEQMLTLLPEWPNWRVTDLALQISSFTTARGPFGTGGADDPLPVPNSFHESRMDADLSRAETCRPCHEVVWDKGPLAGQLGGPQALVHLTATYAEWAASPYAERGVTCQSCHMARLPGLAPVAVAPPGITFERPPPPRARTDHTFAGVDTDFLSDGPAVEQQREQAAARLAGAAAVDLTVPPALAPGQMLEVVASVRNSATGHDLPTGFGFWRELWLEVTVEDATGRVIFASGQLDEEGWLFDEYNPRVQHEPSLYDPYLLDLRSRLVHVTSDLESWLLPDRTVSIPPAAISRNLNGTPIISTAEFDASQIMGRVGGASDAELVESARLQEVYIMRFADTVLKNGIPALQTRQAHYPVAVDATAESPLRVSARLLMRALSTTEMAHQEELPDPLPRLPIFEIDSEQAVIALKR